MCIFPQPVVAVSDTNIFARLDTGNWQYLVYQMQFHTAEKNAIILPIPIAQPAQEKESLEFISLEEYPRFLRTCGLVFLWLGQLASYPGAPSLIP